MEIKTTSIKLNLNNQNFLDVFFEFEEILQ